VLADVTDEEVTTLLRGGKTILLYGSPFVGDYEVYQGALLTEPILIEGDKALYRLVGIGPHR